MPWRCMLAPPARTPPSALDLRTPLDQQRAQLRAVTVFLVLAVAAQRKIGVLRQHSEHVERLAGRRRVHLRAELAEERGPFPFRLCGLGGLHEVRARREHGEPYVVVVATRELRLRGAAGWTTDGAEARAFIGGARGSESDDANGHAVIPRCGD